MRRRAVAAEKPKNALELAVDQQLADMFARMGANGPETKGDRRRSVRLSAWFYKWMRQHPGESRDAAMMAWIDSGDAKRQRRLERSSVRVAAESTAQLEREHTFAEQRKGDRAEPMAKRPAPGPIIPDSPLEKPRTKRKRRVVGVVAVWDAEGNRVE